MIKHYLIVIIGFFVLFILVLTSLKLYAKQITHNDYLSDTNKEIMKAFRKKISFNLYIR